MGRFAKMIKLALEIEKHRDAVGRSDPYSLEARQRREAIKAAIVKDALALADIVLTMEEPGWVPVAERKKA